jgi:hypothetical protein
MRTGRWKWVGVGLAILLTTGVSTLSPAQQAGEKRSAALTPRRELRERLLNLRTEVDVMQLEYDSVRATLVEWMRDQGKAELMGVDMSMFYAEMGLGFATVKYPAGADATELPPGREPKPPGRSDRRREPAPLPPSPYGLAPTTRNEDEKEAIEDQSDRRSEEEMMAWSRKNNEEIRKRIEQRKQEFARKARVLNDKKFELAEVEKQYQREAP